MLQLSMAEGNTSATYNKEEKMEELKKKLDLILYDLQEARGEMDGNKDYVENACCRIHTAIFNLEQLYKALCAEADEM